MANNPYVNRVETADGTTLMDITDTTAEASDVETGRVFYTASGTRTVGTGSGGSGKLDQVAAYAEYSSSETYAVGDIVTVSSRIWQCTTAISTAEAWTESHWTETDIDSILSAELAKKADKADTVLTTTLSRGRKANTTVGQRSFAFGNNVTASAENTHAEGSGTTASSDEAHAEGYQTSATGLSSHSEGNATTASGDDAHSEGNSTVASGDQAHAEGMYSVASGTESHAEGYNTTASNYYAHSEGNSTTASGMDAHAEGSATLASGSESHAEGEGTIASGRGSHASGTYNVADSYANWPEWVAGTSYSVGDKVKITTTANNETTVAGYICSTANSDSSFTSANWEDQTGKMNYAEIVGIGKNALSRTNGRALDWEGNERLKGNLYVGCNGDSSGGSKVVTESFVTGKIGAANGIAELDENGLVPSSQLPSYVDDVLEYDDKEYTFGAYAPWMSGQSYAVGAKVFRAGDKLICIEANSDIEFDSSKWRDATFFPVTGESGKIYVDTTTNITYRWSGSVYVAIGSDLALGETSSTAYRGDRGKAAYDASVVNVDTTPTASSSHLITSGGVKAALPVTMTGATSSTAGAGGLVPAPSAGDEVKFLKGDGTWSAVSSSSGSAFIEYDVDIATTDWSGNGPYTYTWTNSNVFSDTLVDLFYKSSARTVLRSPCDIAKSTGSVTLTVDEVPSGTLSVIFRLIQNTNAAVVGHASTTTEGIVQLSDSTSDSSTSKAATANAVKTVNDLLGTIPSGTTVQGQIDTVSQSIGTVPTGETVESQISTLNGKISSNSVTHLESNSAFIDYVVRGNICCVRVGGTPTAASVTFTVPKALIGYYLSIPQWASNSTIMQIFIDADSTTLTIRNYATSLSINAYICYPINVT